MASEWTVDTLKEHYDALRAQDQHAIAQASEVLNRRLGSMNEFREQLRDQTATFVTKEFADEQLRIRSVHEDSIDARFSRLERWQAKIVGACALAMLIVPLVTALVVYLLTRHAVPVDTPKP